ncbi:class I SAM-dependent methyltransferase [Acinetobacter colistiniresistens]|uniref:Class I SAM-dependent methyltransferase n=1 Tax=Acinetobacter colistiniresistens TaxID=280145 RepID=A0A558F891_9GAMM|nr:class I SAM-dependent methyltransferase [Acinetobacter colistiniresistens]TVT81815.1 class I SAM-dependent methyltransferase [Acinetobacter colistiniresistens]
MTQSLHPAAEKGFSLGAELYQQVRPSYPQEIAVWLQDRLQVGESSTVVDLGAGTGKFLPYLMQTQAKVIAVEPVTEMLQQLQQTYPTVECLQAFSNELPFANASIDAILCAQSFHWFANLETLTEIHRVLTASGHLGLIWNQRDSRVDWVKALADAIAPLEGDTPRYHSELWKQVFENQTLFKLDGLQTFQQAHQGTVEQVVSKRLLSTSFIAAMPTVEQQQLKAKFEQIVFDFTGLTAQDQISFPYTTFAYHFRKISN